MGVRALRTTLLVAAVGGPWASLACVATANARLDLAPRDLYRQRCSMCHAPRDPARYDFATLDRFLNRFAWRAGITDEEKPVIRAFLQSAARDAPASVATKASTGESTNSSEPARPREP